MQRCARFTVLLALLAAGCAGDGDAMQKRLDEIGRELGRVRTSNAALEDRVAALEEGATATEKIETARAPADRPKLEVVRLVPEGPSEAPPPEAPVAQEDGLRPVLRADASGGEITVGDTPTAPPARPKSYVMRKP